MEIYSWKQRISLDQLIFILIFCSCVFVRVNSDKCNICATGDCVKAAQYLLDRINETTDPCDDFYEFSCGRISDIHTRVSSMLEQNKEYMNKLHNIFTKEEPLENIPKIIAMTKDVYKSCINETKIEEDGIRPLLEFIDSLGKWPVLEENWDQNTYDWNESMYKHYVFGGYSGFFNYSLRYPEAIFEPTFYFHPDTKIKRFDHEKMSSYIEYMVSVATLLGANQTVARKDMTDVLNFEKKLANVVREAIDEPDEDFSNISHLLPVTDIMYVTDQSDIDILTVKDEILRLGTDKQEIVDLVMKTPKRILANFAVWKTIERALIYSIKQLRNAWYDFRKLPPKERKDICIELIKDSELVYVLNEMYVRKYFRDDMRKETYEIIKNVRKEARHMIENIKWIDKKTKMGALKKLDKMNVIVGDNEHQKYFKSNSINENDYNQLVDRNTFLGKYLVLNQIILNTTNFSNYYDVVRSLDVINAYCVFAGKNYIVIPNAYIHELIKSYKRPKYMDYAILGATTVGHEIFHRYDTTGIKFDADGNQRKWFTKNKHYEDKVECLKEKYGNYTIEEFGTKVDGALTINENIADVAGYIAGYNAYIKWTEQNGQELLLPGLQDYTQRQLFWISLASDWCSLPLSDKKGLDDVHSPARFRILGPLSDIKEFAKDFNCPIGSNMNPVRKCNILE